MIHRASLFYFIVQFLCCLCGDENTSQPHVTDGDSIDEVQDCENYKFKNCSELSNLCLQCDKYDSQCTYGEWSNVTCTRKPGVTCEGGHEIVKEARCVFCYQTEKWEHTCSFSQNQACSLQTKYYRANCTANPEVMCLGPRKFSMRLRCNITKGHRWSTALMLSITLGGFGADRFYLGHWQEGIGKLFSFGGLGVWTLVDVLLIAIRYLGPADGSLYV